MAASAWRMADGSQMAREADADDRRRFYRGDSMRGTFRPGDYLTLEPVSITDVRPGDVVVFRGQGPEGESDDVVHRVAALAPGGLATRGDNNPTLDSALVTQDNLLGRVTHVERSGRARPVLGGRRGLLRARALRAWARVRRWGWRLIRAVGGWPYRLLRKSCLVRRLWQPAIARVRVETETGPLVKYLHRGRTVAWWWPESGRFRCRRPYDLVITHPGRKSPLDHETSRQD